jgi:hypothetical protein
MHCALPRAAEGSGIARYRAPLKALALRATARR